MGGEVTVESEPFFHGDITLAESRRRLAGKLPGTFLVRRTRDDEEFMVDHVTPERTVFSGPIRRWRGHYCVGSRVYFTWKAFVRFHAVALRTPLLRESCGQ